VGYRLDDLRAVYRQRVEEAGLSADESKLLSDALEAGLTGYTYLSDEPLA
jgi:arginine decarboxylase